MKKKREHLNDLQKFRIVMLATNGGFSDRFIASVVHHTTVEKVTDGQLQQVTRYRLGERKLLSNWRMGRSVLAVRHVQQVTKSKSKRHSNSQVA